MSKHEVEVFSLSRGEIEFDGCLKLQSLEPTLGLGLGIDITSNLKTLATELIVEAFQHARGTSQLSHRRKSAHGIILSENPTVVIITYLPIGHRCCIAQKHILAHCITDDTTI